MKKKANKSKEELVGTIQQNQKITKLQAIVRDKVFPSLLDNCKTVQEAEVVLAGFYLAREILTPAPLLGKERGRNRW